MNMKKFIACLLMVFVCAGAIVGCGNKENVPVEGLTKERFDNLKLGTSELEYINNIGPLGNTIAEKTENGIITRTYKVEGVNGGEAILTFEQKMGTMIVKLVSKEQDGLK